MPLFTSLHRRWFLFSLALGVAAHAIAATTPNVVLIYGDDVGYGDVGAYGSKLIPTPNLDKLASQGLVFTDGHCSSSTCTPSRYSMLTGGYGFRKNVAILPPNAPLCIKPGTFTLPEMFRQAGYHTGVIGKWHLGLGVGAKTDWNGEVKPGPLEIGFDESFLLPSTNDRVPCVYLKNHRVVNLDPADPLYVTHNAKAPTGFQGTIYPDGQKDPSAMTYYPSTHGHNQSVINGIGRIGYQWGGKAALWNDETMADVFVDEARRFISASKEKPFFLYFASQDIHVPRTPHKRFQGKTTLGKRGDAMVQLDWTVGEIMKALDEEGLADNTMVIFSSDNGPVYDDGYADGTTVKGSSQEVDNGHDGSGPYRGGKYQVYEGGTRVPFIIRWPGKITPGTSDALVGQIDFLASFAKLLNITIPEGQAADSRNTVDAFLGKDPTGLPYLLEESHQGLALIERPWKFVSAKRKGSNELFNLANDPGEKTNIISKHPEIAASMLARLEKLSQ
jgi:arylsulfatase A